MSQIPYFRDVWALGPGVGYPGAFPLGFVQKIRKRWWGQKRLWLFSGSFKDEGGVTMDIQPELGPSVVGNCESLPFADDSFDFVCADPPYSEEESRKLYNLPYVSIVRALNEMGRVVKEGGHVLFLHRLIPGRHPSFTHFRKLQLVGVVGVFTIAGMTNMRALTVWQKKNTLKVGV